MEGSGNNELNQSESQPSSTTRSKHRQVVTQSRRWYFYIWLGIWGWRCLGCLAPVPSLMRFTSTSNVKEELFRRPGWGVTWERTKEDKWLDHIRELITEQDSCVVICVCWTTTDISRGLKTSENPTENMLHEIYASFVQLTPLKYFFLNQKFDATTRLPKTFHL